MARKGIKKWEYGQCYVVTWIDHFVHNSETAWTDQSKIDPTPCVIHTAGFLVKNTPKSIALAQSVTLPLEENESVGSVMVIVKKCIQNVQRVKV